MLKIGLTGGIGSGKSIVAEIFKLRGIPIFNADVTAKNIMNEDEELKEKIINIFGADAYANDILNRKYIADIVFNDSLKLERLNALVHPATINAAEKWMQNQNAPYAIKESAILFESGSNKKLDYIIGVSAPEQLRITRVVKREGIEQSEVLARINKQMNEETKMSLCDFIILNDEQHLIIPQVIALHQKLLSINKSM